MYINTRDIPDTLIEDTWMDLYPRIGGFGVNEKLLRAFHQ